MSDVSTLMHRRVDRGALYERTRVMVTANQIAFASWAALTAIGIVEAQVSFAPRRAAAGPSASRSITATAAPVLGGAVVGVRTAF